MKDFPCPSPFFILFTHKTSAALRKVHAIMRSFHRPVHAIMRSFHHPPARGGGANADGKAGPRHRRLWAVFVAGQRRRIFSSSVVHQADRKISATSLAASASTTTISSETPRRVMAEIPSLKEFMKLQSKASGAAVEHARGAEDELVAHGSTEDHQLSVDALRGLRFYVETYGCQMNTADSEIVKAVLIGAGLVDSPDEHSADVVLINTCAIRENAENKIWERLRNLRGQINNKTTALAGGQISIGLLGCMAERLKGQLLEGERPLVDFVAGPDAYRDVPRLISRAVQGHPAMNVQLSLEETYAEIAPVRPASNGVTAYISIMRGCNNMCSFCVVPFTRGRERSRDLASIVNEVKALQDQGYKEVTLLGQNVNSYWDKTALDGAIRSGGYTTFKGFNNLYKLRDGEGARFVDLLDAVSRAAPRMRFRFTSPHPKDFPVDLLSLIAERTNICSSLHMPAQSGSSAMLTRMRRGYTREAYLELVATARKLVPNLSISTDIIVGFCGETEEEHLETLSLMREVRFEQAFTFAYSERSHTHAKHKMKDDVPEHTKMRRLNELIAVFRECCAAECTKEVGREHIVLVEGHSRRSTPENPQLMGRTDNNKKCVFDANFPVTCSTTGARVNILKGDYLRVKVHAANPATLHVEPLERVPHP